MFSMEVTEEGFKQLSDLVKWSTLAKCSARVLLDEMDLKLIK